MTHTTTIPMLAVTSYRSWNDFFEWAQRLVRGTDDSNDELKELAKELSADRKSDVEKIRAVYDYAANLRYVAIHIGANAFRPHTATSVLAKQYGDCKDKATLIISLLREMNIPSQLVLVARSRSFDDSFPGFQFNHAVAAVPQPEGTLWLDATDECCPFGMMPPGDAGQKALIFRKDKNTFEQIPYYNQGYKAETLCQVDLKLEPSGIASGKLHIEFAGLTEYSWRGMLRHKTVAETEKKFVLSLRSLFHGIVVNKVSFNDPSSLSTPLTADVEFQVPLYDPQSKNLSLPLFYPALSQNLDIWKRSHAFEFNEGYPDRFIQQIKVSLPFKQKAGPKLIYQKALPQFFSAQMETEFQANELLRTVTIDLKNPIIPAQKLSELREALDAWTVEVHKPANIQPE
jgi:cellulose synthase operon protein C